MEALEEILSMIPFILQALGGLAIAATAIARITPSPKDDELASKFTRIVNKLISWCPTIGPNPKVK